MSKQLLAKLNDDLKLAGYAKRSCQSYVRAVRQLMNFWGKPLEEIEEQQVREYPPSPRLRRDKLASLQR